jgi:hypothetical protein
MLRVMSNLRTLDCCMEFLGCPREVLPDPMNQKSARLRYTILRTQDGAGCEEEVHVDWSLEPKIPISCSIQFHGVCIEPELPYGVFHFRSRTAWPRMTRTSSHAHKYVPNITELILTGCRWHKTIVYFKAIKFPGRQKLKICSLPGTKQFADTERRSVGDASWGS